MSVASKRALKTVGGIAFCVLAVTVAVLAGRRLTSTSWPLQEANVVLVLTASAAYLASFVFRALGWQRLFPGELVLAPHFALFSSRRNANARATRS